MSTAPGPGDDRPLAPPSASGPPPAGETVEIDSPAAGADAAPALPAEFGRYRVEGLLGRGGMGAVYRAHDTQLDRPVALKVPHLAGGDRDRLAARFLREARAAARLQHPNICPVFDAGEIGGAVYLSMALVEGAPLAQRLKAGPLPPAEAAAVVRAVALAMAEAHRAGVVHRDLKPANILLNARGEPVVTDFGLARDARSGGEERLTRDGALVGTPAYMPPEQVGGQQAGPSGDIYSLGIVLYECLAGRPPFRAASLAGLVAQIERDLPPPPSQSRPGLPTGLEAACLRSLAKTPGDRFASMAEFAAALAPFAGPAPPSASETTEFLPPRRRRWPLPATAAALVSVALGAVWYATRDRGRAEPEARAPAGARPETSVEREKLARLLAAGRDHLRQERFDDLQRVAEEALQIDPQSPGALGLRAAAASARGRQAEARADAAAALQLNPDEPLAYFIRGAMIEGPDQVDAAIADFTVCIRLAPSPHLAGVAYNNRALNYLRKGEYHQAVADATEALKCGHAGTKPLSNRGSAYVHLGEYAKARADYEAAGRLGPSDPQWHLVLSVIRARMGDPEKAKAHRDLAVKLGAPSDAALTLPDPPKPVALKKLTPAEQAELDRALADLARAADGNRHEETIRTADRALRVQPGHLRARAHRASALAGLRRFEDALRDANEAVRLGPLAAAGYSVRSYVHAAAGQFAAAVADATIAVRLGPSDHDAWNNRAYSYARLGVYGQAVADATEALTRAPGLVRALSNRGAAYVRLGEYAKALADYDAAAGRDPLNPEWLEWCAVLHARLGQVDRAQAARKRAIQLDRTVEDRPPPTLPEPPPPPHRDPELPAG